MSWTSRFAQCAAWACCATGFAQFAPAPTQYAMTCVNLGETLHIYRDGDKALVDTYLPKGPDQPVEIHTRTIVDIPSRTDLTWDLLDPKIPCNTPATGDWGDPFGYWDQTLQGTQGAPVKVGEATQNGMATTVYEVHSADGDGRLWRENRYGLLVKFVATPKGGAPVTMIDIQSFQVGRPDPSVFAVPARCTWKK